MEKEKDPEEQDPVKTNLKHEKSVQVKSLYQYEPAVLGDPGPLAAPSPVAPGKIPSSRPCPRRFPGEPLGRLPRSGPGLPRASPPRSRPRGSSGARPRTPFGPGSAGGSARLATPLASGRKRRPGY